MGEVLADCLPASEPIDELNHNHYKERSDRDYHVDRVFVLAV